MSSDEDDIIDAEIVSDSTARKPFTDDTVEGKLTNFNPFKMIKSTAKSAFNGLSKWLGGEPKVQDITSRANNPDSLDNIRNNPFFQLGTTLNPFDFVTGKAIRKMTEMLTDPDIFMGMNQNDIPIEKAQKLAKSLIESNLICQRYIGNEIQQTSKPFSLSTSVMNINGQITKRSSLEYSIIGDYDSARVRLQITMDTRNNCRVDDLIVIFSDNTMERISPW
jgi:hypothetical protein